MSRLRLTAHPSVDLPAHQLDVSVASSGRKLRLEFTVKKKLSGAWLPKTSAHHDFRRNWGLWEGDVVEAFLQLRQHEGEVEAPYVEIQLSPAGHGFALVILKPREKYYTPLALDYSYQASTTQSEFQGVMEINLPIEFKGEYLFVGLFACLGESDEREYYALNPNSEERPDFHRPELFRKLS